MPILKKQQRHSTHQTQWAAQFAVASELCKRGYEVAITSGNHPRVDLMVRSPSGRSFDVDVKGQYKRNLWPVAQKEPREELFYVFAFVPNVKRSNDAPIVADANRFFILTQDQVNQGMDIVQDAARQRRKAKGRLGEPGKFTGVHWNFAEGFENHWETFPS